MREAFWNIELSQSVGKAFWNPEFPRFVGRPSGTQVGAVFGHDLLEPELPLPARKALLDPEPLQYAGKAFWS